LRVERPFSPSLLIPNGRALTLNDRHRVPVPAFSIPIIRDGVRESPASAAYSNATEHVRSETSEGQEGRNFQNLISVLPSSAMGVRR
jgi:hypothetical protein